MKKYARFGMFLSLLAGLARMAMPGQALVQPAQAAAPQTYTIMVGAENVPDGIDVMAFFPAT
jgi:hypothetical protein